MMDTRQEASPDLLIPFGADGNIAIGYELNLSSLFLPLFLSPLLFLFLPFFFFFFSSWRPIPRKKLLSSKGVMVMVMVVILILILIRVIIKLWFRTTKLLMTPPASIVDDAMSLSCPYETYN
jgi:hypothetical protein